MISDKHGQQLVHPCFQEGCHSGRIHLPVALRCNMQCGYCLRKYDCVNESRPGVTSRVMTPAEAVAYYQEQAKRFRLSVAGIAGPGDPLANWEETEETLRLIHSAAPDLHLCLSTNGLTGNRFAGRLYGLGVRFVTLTINAMDEECAEKIYEWVADGCGNVLHGKNAAAFLLKRQREALQAFSAQGFYIKINTVLIPRINENQIAKIARVAACYGSKLINIIPLIPTEKTRFADFSPPSAEVLSEYRAQAQAYLPLMHHCQHCRADAVGYLEKFNP
ncbi:MAG TPA: radical SAM protein [Candidatus Anaerofilum excrementigallinarum]|nr:radical SAM protein [Candidatus Anaerofilum excrementigallinarum]